MKQGELKVTILGTGTSQGIPVIGCKCPVCCSKDPLDKRLRTSALLSVGGENVVIDVGPDFRAQMLSAGIEDLEAAVITHEHNDHIIGLDDIRPFNFMRRRPLTVFATRRVQQALIERFQYVFDTNPYPGAPRVALANIDPDQPLEIGPFTLLPIKVNHGIMPVLGFRVDDFTYITDAKTIEPEELEKARFSKVLVLNALHLQPHHSHFNLEEALAIIDFLKPEKAYLTHISHHMGLHKAVNTLLPDGVKLAYDGLVINL
jgi:phosphoribosyl 1,2-cyclic phosphate phosphodiesterase